MKVIIENWEPIEKCEYNLDKSVSVTYGENNIGKSYAMQLIYLYLKNLIFFAKRQLKFKYYYFGAEDSVVRELVIKFAENETTNEKDITQNLIDIFSSILEENVLSDYIFEKLESVPLIDKYNAYQILDDEWSKIAIDLEVIQTEGFSATKKVDPNLVIKKKDGKEQEIQEGWLGHVIPFELIQATILKEQNDSLKAKENRVVEIASMYEEILDSLSEEEKEADTVNEDKTAFVNAEVNKAVKQIKAENKGIKLDEESYEAKIIKVADLLAEEKDLKAKIKKETADLQMKTKETIEGLSDQQVLELLKEKWIVPLTTALNKLPDNIINELAAKVKQLSEKYAITFSDVENDIEKTETELSSMIDELTGNDYDMKGLDELKSLLKGA